MSINIQKKLWTMTKSQLEEVCHKMKCPTGTKKEMVGHLLRPFGMKYKMGDFMTLYDRIEEVKKNFIKYNQDDQNFKPFIEKGLNNLTDEEIKEFVKLGLMKLSNVPNRDPNTGEIIDDDLTKCALINNINKEDFSTLYLSEIERRANQKSFDHGVKGNSIDNEIIELDPEKAKSFCEIINILL